MKLSLCCPSCGKTIAELHRHSLQSQIVCLSCGERYGVVYGKLSRRSSIQEALLYLKSTFPSFYKRHYTLQITTVDRTYKNLQFSIPGKADVVPVHRGDLVSVIYTMQGYVMKKLVAIANHTTGKNYILPQPIPSSSRHALKLLTIVSGFLGISFLTGFNVLLTALLSAIGVLLHLKLSNQAQITSPMLDNHESQDQRLIADQRLMAQHRKIEQRIAELEHESKSNLMLIEQLETLKRKMSQVDQALYSARIYRATGAVKILKQQIVNSHRLIREYGRTLKMIEIEIDTSWIADQLPDVENFTRTIIGKLAELKEIEEQNQSLKIQLAAYEEVGLYGIGTYQ